MEHVEIDLEPEHLIAWLMDRAQAETPGVEIRASRDFLAGEDRGVKGADQDESEAHEVAAVGLLEVSPVGEAEPWQLYVRIEDEMADRLPPDEAAPAGPEEIDLSAFWDEFLNPLRGTVALWASVPNAAAERRLSGFLASLERRPEG